MDSLRLFFSDPEYDTAIDSSVIAFVESSGVSWEVYANFDQDLATNRTIGEDWEAALLEKAKAGTSAKDKADTYEDQNEEEEKDEMVIDKATLSVGTAISYPDELRDFALSRQSPELLELIVKARLLLRSSCAIQIN